MVWTRIRQRLSGKTPSDALLDSLDVPAEQTAVEALIHYVMPSEEKLESRGEIARGGVGVIEVVTDAALKRRQAMKIIRPERRFNEHMVRWFLREAQITSQLDHPNIVPVHELGCTEDCRVFFTMKLVSGMSLDGQCRRFKRGIPDTPDALLDLLEVIIRACDALAFAHSRGVLHCDIKPDNIMVGDFGQVYLMDWGMARLFGDEVLTSVEDTALAVGAVGTPAFMSPEQAKCERLDQRSDVFLMGATLYRLLCGRPPFFAKTGPASLKQAIDGQCPKASSFKHIPPRLAAIVDRAMEIDPQARYQSATAMKQALVGFVRGTVEFPSRTVAAGEWITREGDEGAEAYIIAAGELDVFRGSGGDCELIRTMGPGEVFGETAVLTDSGRTASVVARTDAVLLVVTREQFEQELAQLKSWVGVFFRTLARRFGEREANR